MAFEDSSAQEADHFLFLALLLVLFWVPLPVGSNHLWAWSVFEVCVFVLAIVWLVLFALGQVSTTPVFRRAWPVLLLFALVFVWVVFQLAPLPPSWIALLSPGSAEIYGHTQTAATLSLDPSGTRAAALKTLSYGVLFAMTLLLINHPGRLRTLALVLVLSGVFQVAFGATMTLSGLEYGFLVEKSHGTGYLTGTFINQNHLAGYLGMCLALGIGLILSETPPASAIGWRENVLRRLITRRGHNALMRLALIIMVTGLVLSYSRMGNLAFFSSLVVTGGYFLLVVRGMSAAVVALFVVFLLIGILIIGNFTGIDNASEEILRNSGTSMPLPIDVRRDSLNMVQDFPLTGTGAGSFASVYPMYDSGKVGFWYFQHAHNDYLQFTSEFGLPGIIMLAGIVLLSLWNAARAQIKRNDRLLRGLGCGVAMSIVALLIHSVADFNLQIPANAATFVVILAMGWQTRWMDL